MLAQCRGHHALEEVAHLDGPTASRPRDDDARAERQHPLEFRGDVSKTSASRVLVPAWQPSVAEQVSTPSQKRPFEHWASSGVLSHESVVSLQASTVQLTPSSQVTGVPDSQMPALQVSTPSQ